MPLLRVVVVSRHSLQLDYGFPMRGAGFSDALLRFGKVVRIAQLIVQFCSRVTPLPF